MKKVWVLYQVFSDNCTYSHYCLYSIHETEDGAIAAYMALEKLKELGKEHHQDVEIKEQEVLP